jgi:excisionase family DNA binding protein
LGVGRSTIYELIASGELRTLKIGRRTLITVESQDALVARRLAKEAA